MKRLFYWLFSGPPLERRRTAPVAAAGQFDQEAFRARLRGLADGDVLWEQLLALIDANVWTETGIGCTPGLDDAEAHRFRGRVGMLLDLKADLIKEWNETHAGRKDS